MEKFIENLLALWDEFIEHKGYYNQKDLNLREFMEWLAKQ